MPILFEPIDEDEAAAEAERIKTMAEQQSSALRLADALALAERLEGRWALHPEMQEAAAELRRLAAVEAERDKLREANAAFADRQEWWNERMFTLEAQREADAAAMRQACEALILRLRGEETWLKDSRGDATGPAIAALRERLEAKP